VHRWNAANSPDLFLFQDYKRQNKKKKEKAKEKGQGKREKKKS